MINLLDAEVASLRYRSRTAAAIIGLLLLGLLSPMLWMSNAKPLSEAERRQGMNIYAEQRSYCPDCQFTDYLRQVWSFTDVVTQGIQPFLTLVALITLVIVLFYVGSDFQSGALWTRLTFTPRRTQVLVARVLISGLLGAVMMGLTVVISTLVSATWYVALKGFADLTTDGILLELVGAAVLYGAIMGMVGALATFLMNGTIGAGVVLLGVIVISLLGEAMGYQGPRPIMHLSPLRQQEALLLGTAVLWTPSGKEHFIGRPEAIIYHVIVVGLMFAVTIPLFKRRDLKF